MNDATKCIFCQQEIKNHPDPDKQLPAHPNTFNAPCVGARTIGERVTERSA